MAEKPEKTDKTENKAPQVQTQNTTLIIVNTVLTTLLVILLGYIIFTHANDKNTTLNNSTKQTTEATETNNNTPQNTDTTAPTKAPSQTTKPTTATPKPTKVPAISSNKNSYTWLTYKDSKHPRITFKYPKGAKITAKLSSDKSEYTVTANYKNQLFIKVREILMGIGGVPYPAYTYNRVVYDRMFLNNNARFFGILALTQTEPGRIGFDYQKFDEFRRLNVEAVSMQVTMPNNIYNPKYDALLDYIGTSIWGISNPINKSGLPYATKSAFYGIINFKPVILLKFSSNQKAYDHHVGMEPYRYASLILEDNNKQYLYAFDVKTQNIIKLNGNTRFGPIEMGDLYWFDTDKFVLWDGKSNKYYKGDVINKSLTQISKNEYQSYIAIQ